MDVVLNFNEITEDNMVKCSVDTSGVGHMCGDIVYLGAEIHCRSLHVNISAMQPLTLSFNDFERLCRVTMIMNQIYKITKGEAEVHNFDGLVLHTWSEGELAVARIVDQPFGWLNDRPDQPRGICVIESTLPEWNSEDDEFFIRGLEDDHDLVMIPVFNGRIREILTILENIGGQR